MKRWRDVPEPQRFWITVAAVLAVAATIAAVNGCVSLPADDGGKDYAVGPVWHSGPSGEPDPIEDMLPWWGKAAVGLALGFAVPRTRENLVGAGKALATGDIKDAALH